jgi:GR25 family glycosyltransferase involved in LPS biosynthesis
VNLDVFCLTLPRSIDRRASFDSEAKRVGLAFEYVYGLDARESPPGQLEALAIRERAMVWLGRPLALTEIACAAGHRQIYRTLVAGKADAALIIEDDIRLDDRFVEIVNGLKKLDPETGRRAEIFLLGCLERCKNYPLLLRRRKPQRVTDSHRLVRVVRSDLALQGAYCYLITRAAAAAVLRNEPMVATTADAWDLRRLEGTLQDVWVMEPRAAFHDAVALSSLIDIARSGAEMEAEGLRKTWPHRIKRAVRISSHPRKLARSLAYRLGWRRVEYAVYALLSRLI